jgi:hypothetical protein
MIGLGGFLLTCGESIEVDESRIVGMGRCLEQSTTVNLHQGLHTPGV